MRSSAVRPSPVRERDKLARYFAEIALEAGIAIMEVYAAPVSAGMKADGSPVTEADMRAEAIILAHLAHLLPGVPILSEEAVSPAELPILSGSAFVAVDPLD